ncbi:MAG: hypothetical protein HRU15_18960 [Planctomycetes bacterium]|nr:hypothetical protein [Planctomycetota bacterium]
MSKIGYLAVSLLLCVMLWYLFGDSTVVRNVHIFKQILPEEFIVQLPGWKQEVRGEDLRINGIERPMARNGVKSLRKYLKRMRVPGDRIIEDVDVADLSAYGINGDRELRFNDQRFRWGINGQGGYLWNENTAEIFVMRANAIESLDKYCKRFDDQTLLSGLDRIRSINLGELQLNRLSQYGGWIADKNMHRPAFNSRGNALVGYLKQLKLISLTGVDHKNAQEILRISLEMLDDSKHDYVFLQRDQEYFMQVDQLPMQKCSARQWQSLQHVLDELDKDYLFDFSMDMEGLPFDRIIIEHGGSESYRLQRHGIQDVSYDIPGYSYWSMQWPGGREAANSEIGYRLFALFNQTAVSDVQLLDDVAVEASAADPQVASIILMSGEEVTARLNWHKDNTLVGPFHRAKITDENLVHLPIQYAQLFDPGMFLNPHILPIDMRRIEKIQRIYYDEQDVKSKSYYGELLNRHSQTDWQRSLYVKLDGRKQHRSENADGMACTRLAMFLSQLQAKKVELMAVENLTLMEDPQYGFDIRIAAWDNQKGEDDQILEETLARDWGMSLKNIDGIWWAMNRAQTVRYQLSEEHVNELMSGVQDTYLFSGVVSHIQSMDVKLQEEHYFLKQGRDQWSLHLDDQQHDHENHQQHVHPVAAHQIRSYMRSLSLLRALDIDEEAPVISAETADVIIAISLPGIDEVSEQISLFIAAVDDEYYHVSAHAISGVHPFQGVARVKSIDMQKIIRKHSWFIVEPESGSEQESEHSE